MTCRGYPRTEEIYDSVFAPVNCQDDCNAQNLVYWCIRHDINVMLALNAKLCSDHGNTNFLWPGNSTVSYMFNSLCHKYPHIHGELEQLNAILITKPSQFTVQGTGDMQKAPILEGNADVFHQRWNEMQEETIAFEDAP
ncbi:hypothetical protein JCGZ_03012 [Jatropha curcas]|uniref:Uncharacterized protein n=1 Tax=Jatropha curcas TaxID=180498 RepID=A0A067LCC6_JATCU|nr:hypothetical protein JCGZ_03012 [Jatropha curcas]